jgi:hypothetical protein
MVHLLHENVLPIVAVDLEYTDVLVADFAGHLELKSEPPRELEESPIFLQEVVVNAETVLRALAVEIYVTEFEVPL